MRSVFLVVVLVVVFVAESTTQALDLCTPSSCGQDADCITHATGRIICVCPPGFSGDPLNRCVDIDECRDFSSSPCDINAVCINDPGTYKCECKDGFVGDGMTCEENCKDEATWCASWTQLCDSNKRVRDACPKSCALCGLITCAQNPWMNGGKCKMNAEYYYCDCPEHHSGMNCETGPAQTGLMWIGQIKEEITSTIITYFSFYDYDTKTDDHLHDGCADMYDDGNFVNFWADNEAETRIVYGNSYDRGDYEFSSTKRYPFTALMYIKNAAGKLNSFSIKVNSEAGADGLGALTYFNGSSVTNGVHVVYSVTQIHDARDPSICELYFAFSKERSLTRSFKTERLSDTTSVINTTVTLTNRPQDAFMGYMLLSKYRVNPTRLTFISESEVKLVLDRIVHALFVLPDPVQQGLARIGVAKKQIIGNIHLFHKYTYDSALNNMIEDGGKDMYDNGNKVSFWGDRERKTRATYGEHYDRRDYVFTSGKGWPFKGLMHIRNNRKRRVSYFIQVQSNIGGGPPRQASLSTSRESIEIHGINVHIYVAQVYGLTVPSTCEVYFALSKKKSSGWPFIGQSKLISSKKLTTTVTITSYPRDVWFGYMLFSRNTDHWHPSKKIPQDEIIGALTPAIEALMGCPESSVTLALYRAGLVQDLLVSDIPVFELYEYKEQNNMSPDHLIYADTGGNKVFMSSTENNATQISYGNYYNRGHFEYSSIKGLPFIALMHIKNNEKSVTSYAVEVESSTIEVNVTSYEGSTTAYGIQVTYASTQAYGKYKDRMISEVYFAFSEDQSVENFFLLEKARDSNSMRTKARLDNSPQNAWMGYMLLSRHKGQIIQQAEVEKAVNRLVRVILDSGCPVL